MAAGDGGAGGGVILGISVLVWAGRRRIPYLLVGWLWYCGTLVPVIGLVQTGGQAMADRYTYLPSLGVLMLAVWGAYELTRGWRHQGRRWSVAGAAAILLCLALTRQQIGYWQDSEALFRHALEVTENNAPGPQQPRRRPRQERPSRRGDPPIPGSHSPQTGYAEATTTSASPSTRKAKLTRPSANSRKPSA